jgi:hypothetical protein
MRHIDNWEIHKGVLTDPAATDISQKRILAHIIDRKFHPQKVYALPRGIRCIKLG